MANAKEIAESTPTVLSNRSLSYISEEKYDTGMNVGLPYLGHNLINLVKRLLLGDRNR